MKKLPQSFYLRNDVTLIAQKLIGKKLVSYINGKLTSGIIVETEAYSGKNDKACHSHLNKKTQRTKIMYENGGLAYVYLCYGIHHLFNIVTNQKNHADAVLIRAIEPQEGIDLMSERRNYPRPKYRISSGPGCMSEAMGIQKTHYGTDLTGNLIWIEESKYANFKIASTPRIGVDYAEEDALLPWRYLVKDNPWVSAKNAFNDSK